MFDVQKGCYLMNMFLKKGKIFIRDSQESDTNVQASCYEKS